MANPSIDQLCIQTSQLINDYHSIAQQFYDIFFNATPMDVTLSIYDDTGILQEYTIPNRAKDFNNIKNGNGSPEGVVQGLKGYIYQDLLGADLYIKITNNLNTGWVKLAQESTNIASKTALGSVQIGDNIDVDTNGVVSSPLATSSAFGVVKAGMGITATGGVISVTGGDSDTLDGKHASEFMSTNSIKNYIDGLILSNNAIQPNYKIDISAGTCTNSDNTSNIILDSTLTIDLSVLGVNGRDTGSELNSTWYHIYLIWKADSTTAGLFSLNSSTPTLPTGYIYFRRIGSVYNNSSGNIRTFIQKGDYVYHKDHILDVNNYLLGTTAILFTMSVPTGVQVLTLTNFTAYAGGSILISSPSQNDQAVALNTMSHMSTLSSYQNNYSGHILTNTSGQLRARANAASTNFFALTAGYIDFRGKN
jgi:hypothetical protein